MIDIDFKEVEKLQDDIKKGYFDQKVLLDALEDYKWLLEFKPFEELVNTQPISTEALYDACKAYSRWYGYTQCEIGLQKILFFDGWRKPLEECEQMRIPSIHNSSEWGLEIDEDAWARAVEDRLISKTEFN